MTRHPQHPADGGMTGPLVGVDNYSFHRLLGEVRAGERTPEAPTWTWVEALDAAVDAGADVVALETCFMTRSECRTVLEGRGGGRTMISWGHPHGLAYGTSPSAEEEARAWLHLAAELGHARMRIVIAHPHLREPGDGWAQARQAVPVLARLAGEAGRAGVALAIENHADVTSEQLAWILREVDSSALGACIDTANAVRVGDDAVAAAATLAPWALVAHVKDISSGAWHPTSGPTSVPLGEGVIPVGRVVDVIRDVADDCWFLVELGHLGPGRVDERAMVTRDVAWLRDRLSTHP
jgi:sugar phosphate isomerase/epimerase